MPNHRQQSPQGRGCGERAPQAEEDQGQGGHSMQEGRQRNAGPAKGVALIGPPRPSLVRGPLQEAAEPALGGSPG